MGLLDGRRKAFNTGRSAVLQALLGRGLPTLIIEVSYSRLISLRASLLTVLSHR